MRDQRLHRSIFSKGVTLIEVAFGVTLAALIIAFTTQTIGLFVNAERDASHRVKATYLAEDGLELLRYLRDGSWNTISTLSSNTTYYLRVSTTSIGIVTTTQTIDGFTRSFRIAPVYRNGSDDIVASSTSGATIDNGSKYVTVTVVGGTPVGTTSLITILTDIDQ